MRFQLVKAVRRFNLLAIILISGFMSCKKEFIEISINAFAQLNTEIKADANAFILSFTLQPYPYEETGVRTGVDKNSFYRDTGLSYHKANMMAPNRFAIYLDPSFGSKDFFYQIYVKDGKTSKIVYSEVFSYKK